MTVKLSDIAAEAGCSSQTVSLALSGKPNRIPEATKARVRQIATRLGYRPNVSAGCLRGKTAKAVGIIQPDMVIGCYVELARSVTRHLKRLGYQAYFSVQETPEQIDGLIRDFMARDVDGVMVLQCKSFFNPAEYPLPVLNVCEMNKFYELGIDLREGGRLAAKHLIEAHGRKRIAFIGTNPSVSNGMKIQGVADALSEAGLGGSPVPSIELSGNAGFREELRALVSTGRADSFLCGNDYVAGKTARFLTRHGVRIPEDIALIGFDGMSFCEFAQPPLSSVVQPMGELGRRAVELLAAKMESKAARPQYPPALIKPSLHIGRSCGCLPKERDLIYWNGTDMTLEQLAASPAVPLPERLARFFDPAEPFEPWLGLGLSR
jgi:DNA-binding LacI/PurR family transcriptional regulator